MGEKDFKNYFLRKKDNDLLERKTNEELERLFEKLKIINYLKTKMVRTYIYREWRRRDCQSR